MELLPQEERTIIAKLLLRSHISVPEINLLPDKKIRKSMVVAVVKDALKDESWFPFEVKEYAGPIEVIEKKEENIYILHSYADAEQLRTTDDSRLHTQKSYVVIEDAIQDYLKHKENQFDGVEIDWVN